MTKIGELLGLKGNPVYDTFSSNRQMLLGALSGAAQNPSNPWGGATQGVAQGAAADDAYATAQKEEAARQSSLNQTIEFMRSKGYDDLIAGVEGGGLDMGTAWSEALKRSAPGYGQADQTADMQNFEFAQANPGFADFMGGGANAPKPTSGIQEYEYAKGQGYGGTFQEFQQTSRPAPAMNATTQRAILESDDALQAGQAVISGLDRALELNDVAYDGPFADQRSAASALWGDAGGRATQELKNVVTAQALESLKAVFGGMPTEGERKILLEIQGSVDQPKAVREAIYKRARAAAERRIQINQQEGAALRGGDYFTPGYAPGGAAPGGQTSTGLSWSIEP